MNGWPGDYIDVRPEFEIMDFSQIQRARLRRLALYYTHTLNTIENDLGPGSIECQEAITKLQESFFFVQKAIARLPTASNEP